MTRSIILPVTLPNVYQFKKKLTSKFKDKFVLKQLITNEMLGCAILWFITNHNTYFRLRQFSDISISQDTVDSYVRCGRIFKYEFISNLPISRSVKEVWKSVDIWEFSVVFRLPVYNGKHLCTRALQRAGQVTKILLHADVTDQVIGALNAATIADNLWLVCSRGPFRSITQWHVWLLEVEPQAQQQIYMGTTDIFKNA